MKSEQEFKDKYGKGFSQNRYFVFNPDIIKRAFPNPNKFSKQKKYQQ